MLRVLVVDDSLVSRNLLTGILGGEGDIKVVGEASNGLEAVQKVAELRPDVVTMDVQMPGMDGYAATRQIMMTNPTPIVVVSGSTGQDDVEKSLRALDAGALTVIAKPPSPSSSEFVAAVQSFLGTVRSMAAVRVIRRFPPRLLNPEPLSAFTASPSNGPILGSRLRIVTMAASTGGPQAVRAILRQLSREISVPIVIVQHISNGFTDGLADWLQRTVEIPVQIASHGDTPQPGHVYLAPEARHCGIASNGNIQLKDDPPIGGFRPSATVLFESAARVYGSSHIAVILTGMGSDGVQGLRAVRQTNGIIIAQDAESSVVYGMPKAAVDAGLTDQILPLERIGGELSRLTRVVERR